MTTQIIWRRLFQNESYEVSIYGEIKRTFQDGTVRTITPTKEKYTKIHGVRHRIIDLVAETFLRACPLNHKLVQIHGKDDYSLANLRYVPETTPELSQALNYVPDYWELHEIETHLRTTPLGLREVAILYHTTPNVLRGLSQIKESASFPLLNERLSNTPKSSTHESAEYLNKIRENMIL